jgi:hypothetical protein
MTLRMTSQRTCRTSLPPCLLSVFHSAGWFSVTSRSLIAAGSVGRLRGFGEQEVPFPPMLVSTLGETMIVQARLNVARPRGMRSAGRSRSWCGLVTGVRGVRRSSNLDRIINLGGLTMLALTDNSLGAKLTWGLSLLDMHYVAYQNCLLC